MNSNTGIGTLMDAKLHLKLLPRKIKNPNKYAREIVLTELSRSSGLVLKMNTKAEND